MSLRDIYELEGSERRVLPMEGARGLAVILVFFVHYWAGFSILAGSGTATAAAGHFLWTIGNSGVDLFFVLSGYLIYSAVVKPNVDYGRFLRRRMQRIYPTFLALFAVYFCLSFVFSGQSKLPDSVGRAAVYVAENLLLLPGIFPIRPLVTVAWSLSYEFFYYLVLPLLALTLGFARWRPSRRVAFFTVLGVAFAASWFVFKPFAPRLLMFIAGIVVYEEVKRTKSRGALPLLADNAILAITIATFPAIAWVAARPNGELYRVLISAVAFGLLVYACFRSCGTVARAFSWAPLRWLGNMSYSYYLVHPLVLLGCQFVLLRITGSAPRPLLYWLLIPVTFFGTLVASTIVFVCVERPFSLVTPRQPRIDAVAVS